MRIVYVDRQGHRGNTAAPARREMMNATITRQTSHSVYPAKYHVRTASGETRYYGPDAVEAKKVYESLVGRKMTDAEKRDCGWSEFDR
jgi:hypothetical protein